MCYRYLVYTLQLHCNPDKHDLNKKKKIYKYLTEFGLVPRNWLNQTRPDWTRNNCQKYFSVTQVSLKIKLKVDFSINYDSVYLIFFFMFYI